MAEPRPIEQELRPDFYIAAIGRSGSTALCNWLCRPPEQLVFNEPFFLRTTNPRLLRIQLADFGMPAGEQEWAQEDASGLERFRRLMTARLRGRRWAMKEVLCEEHARVVAAFAPPRVIITVRNIVDVALSFFEKHRVQNNLDRFSDEWVRDYCVREAGGILNLREQLEGAGTPTRVARYEDFTRSANDRAAIAGFVGWQPGEVTDRHLESFDRGFEVERHGTSFSGHLRARSQRPLDQLHERLADQIGEECQAYQASFGYS